MHYLRGKADILRVAGRWRSSVFENVHLVKTFFAHLLLALFVVSAVLALADIRWGERLVEDDREGYDIALAVDVSRSMLASDVKPSRLAGALGRLKRFVSESANTRFSVVAFKGEALAVLPMTGDLQALELVLGGLGPDLLTSTGSSIQKGLEEALETFREGGRYRAVVLVSDGESVDGSPRKAAQAAADNAAPVFSIGVGTAEGSRIVLDSGLLVRDEKNQPVTTRLNRGALETVAEISGGRYYGLNDFRRLERDLLPVLKGAERLAPGLRLERKPRTGLFQLLGLVCLFGLLLIRSFRWRDAI